MYCAVIYDWDGTLADTKDAVVASFQKVFYQNHIIVSRQFIEKRIGIGSRNLIIDALKASGRALDGNLIALLEREKISAEVELTSAVKLFDGALEILDSFCQKAKTALATMNNKAVVYKLLDEMRIKQYFDVVLTAEDIAHAKPDPEIFLKAANALKCSPNECVVLEDSVFGVKASKAARMSCIAVSSGSYSAPELRNEGADLVIESLKEKDRILTFVLDTHH
jgi:HAD superfamily hydrolase (TIGR01509 family)